MKRKIICLITAVLMCAALLPAAALAADADYSYDATVTGGSIGIDTATGTVASADGTVTSVIIPEAIEGYDCTVTAIGAFAFSGCESLKSVTMPDTVTTIGYGAFSGCRALESIHIPAGVTTIEDSVFGDCSSLKAITLDPANKDFYIQDGALIRKSDNTLVAFPAAMETDVFTVPAGVRVIGTYAFSYNSGLKSVIIPDTVTGIGFGAFMGCKNLESVVISGSVKRIEEQAFGACPKLSSVTLSEGIEVIGTLAFYECKSLSAIVIPESVTEIENHCFTGCESLKHINIPKNVSQIGFETFAGCESLEWVSIPAKVDYIGGTAFDRCTSLSRIYYEGSRGQWNDITVDWGNERLQDVRIIYNSSAPRNGPDTITDETTGESVSYSCSGSTISLTGDISSAAPIYVAVYDENGKMTAVSVISTPKTVTFSGVSAQIIWADALSCLPKAESVNIDF